MKNWRCCWPFKRRETIFSTSPTQSQNAAGGLLQDPKNREPFQRYPGPPQGWPKPFQSFPEPLQKPDENLIQEMASDEKIVEIKSSFIHFPQLPAELRIKIWEYAFIPRTITLKRHSSRPALNLRSVEALMLVNHEAHLLFKRSYTRCFHNYGLKAIYINFDLDTLSLSGTNAKRDLKLLLKQYTHTMSKVKYIDLYPEIWRTEFHWDRCKIDEIMTSLQLLTVKLQPSIIATSDWNRLDRYHAVIWNVDSIAKAMGKYEDQPQSIPISKAPRLAAAFIPSEVLSSKLESRFGFSRPGLCLVQPDESTWDRIEATMSKDWQRIWPGRQNCRANHWFVYEFT
jgi:hypothetical protein